jgi:arylsulfatase A-like enzyme
MKYIFFLVLTSLFLACEKVEKAPPNVVFILADDLGWADIGANNPNTFYETPNIDRIAREGVRFTDGYATCPVCSPTRASIMGGQYPARLNTTDWFGAPQPTNVVKHWTRNKELLPAPYNEQLPLEVTTLAEHLNSKDYHTFFAGKWHLGDTGFFPEDQGFDINRGGHKRGSPPGGYFSPYNNPKLDDGPEGEHLPIRLGRESIQFLQSMSEEHQGDPFLLYLSFYSVHTPLQTTEALKTKYEKKSQGLPDVEPVFIPEGDRKARQVQDHPVYGGMMESMDVAVGMVLNALDQFGMADNTMVIFTSDNGGLSTSEGSPTSNLPLRAGKGWLYEGGVRVPTLIRWPGLVTPNTTIDVPMTSMDFYPTILEASGIDNTEYFSDGISLITLLKKNKAPKRDALFWHYPHYGNQGGSPGSAVRSGPYKLIYFFEDKRMELYNLEDDIGEHHSLSDSLPGIRDALFQRIEHWWQETDARFPAPNFMVLTD